MSNYLDIRRSPFPDHGGDVDPDGHDRVGVGLHVHGEGELDAGLPVEVDAGRVQRLQQLLRVAVRKVQRETADLVRLGNPVMFL